MAGVFARGTMKPPLGATINRSHPFGQGVLFALLCNELKPLANATTYAPPAGLVTLGSAPPLQAAVTGPPTWSSNQEGAALHCTTADHVDVSPGVATIWLPTTAVTLAFIRRRTSATLGDRVVAESSGGLIDLYAPYTDGTVYWDFGGTSAPNRLSVAGLSFATATVIPERWVVTAGPQGSSIWRNGIKLASQATAVTRSSNANEKLAFNSNDYNEFNFVQLNTVQWSDPLCQWWSAEPYAHLYPDTARAYEFLTPGSFTTVIQSVGTAAGVATVAGVGAYRTGSGHKSGFGAQKKARRHNR